MAILYFVYILLYISTLSKSLLLHPKEANNSVHKNPKDHLYIIPIIKYRQQLTQKRLDHLAFIQKTLLQSSYSFLQFPKEQYTLKLKNIENSLYIGIIDIGNPAKSIPVLLDTGSIYTWISSTKCDESCINPSIYSRINSSSFKQLSIAANINYGSGNYKLDFNQEKITFGGIKIQSQYFGEIKHQEGEDVINSNEFKGLVGLAYPSMQNNQKYLPLFDSIMSTKLLPRNIMSFYFSHSQDEKGELRLGNIDPSKYEGEIKYYDVIDQYYWMIEMIDVRVNGKSLGLCQGKCKVIFDTGSSLLSGPSKGIKVLLKSLTEKSDCDDNSSGESISFVFEKEEYTLLPNEYLVERIKGNKSKCNPLIEPYDLNNHGPSWVFGDVFFQKYYIILDRDQNKIGIALAKHSSKRQHYNDYDD